MSVLEILILLALGAIVGGAGAVVGAVIGVLVPRRSKDLIYSVK